MDDKMNKYRDMLEMPHHISARRARMPISDRAAQFSPFAALTGHDAAIKETARLTERKIELEETDKVVLDRKLKFLAANIGEIPEIKLKYFIKDELKEGGHYETITGNIYKIDYYSRAIIMQSGIEVNFEDIYEIDGDIFNKVYNR